jgi:hypothetical protein
MLSILSFPVPREVKIIVQGWGEQRESGCFSSLLAFRNKLEPIPSKLDIDSRPYSFLGSPELDLVDTLGFC